VSNLLRIIYFTITASVLMVVSNSLSGAEVETIVFGCNDNPTCPTKYKFQGIPNTMLSLTMVGAKVKVGDHEELFTKRYHEWSYKDLRSLSEEQLQALRGMDVYVRAKCSIYSGDGIEMWPDYVSLWKPSRKTLSCGPGEGITVYLYHPGCDEDPDQHVVFTLTKTKIWDEESIDFATYMETEQLPCYYDYEIGKSFFSKKNVIIYSPHF
jgi:hypothetical protein